jgi:CrcB protein
MNIFLVFLGGGIGAASRYGLSGVMHRWLGIDFPYGTLTVNVLGCLLIGLLMSLFEGRFLINPSLRTFLTIGVLGGFTTFSAFSYETIALMRDAQFMTASLNILINVFSCLLATYAGTIIGKLA